MLYRLDSIDAYEQTLIKQIEVASIEVKDGQNKLYFVVESKGSIFEDILRDLEKAKIHCGREYFKALGGNTQYIVSDNYQTFIDQVLQKDTITT
ncbi:hypothetical protein [Bartonella grahamii]|uniref:Type III restriction-modification system StyLTI enzyme res n=1 Tax=Bartonella grahamii TaxID=33045 RepID=A0A336NEI4_BARGR|nr:hypothetical protein [Bartonella grahamii]SSZ39347.1 type III restriction-modification system StyLTI enzyme res [Bartonella grahamii]